MGKVYRFAVENTEETILFTNFNLDIILTKFNELSKSIVSESFLRIMSMTTKHQATQHVKISDLIKVFEKADHKKTLQQVFSLDSDNISDQEELEFFLEWNLPSLLNMLSLKNRKIVISSPKWEIENKLKNLYETVLIKNDLSEHFDYILFLGEGDYNLSLIKETVGTSLFEDLDSIGYFDKMKESFSFKLKVSISYVGELLC